MFFDKCVHSIKNQVLSLLFSSSVGATSCDGNFLVPPNRDGSVSPILGKRERSTSVIAGEGLNNLSGTFLSDNMLLKVANPGVGFFN